MSKNEVKQVTGKVADEKDSGSTFSFFGTKKKEVSYPPRHVIIDYREGVEKTVKSSVESEIFSVVKDLEWGKSGVEYRIIKVTDHPHLDPGYAYEVQLNGDGGSYLEAALQELKDKSVRQVWIECTKNEWSFVELKNGVIQTSFSPLPAEDYDVVIGLDAHVRNKMKPLFADNYVFYYISLIALFMSTLALTGASLFKYVWLDETKEMVNKKFYTQEQYMPVDALRGASSSSSFRLSAVRYNPAKKWHFILEEKSDGIVTIYEQKVNQDGTYGPRVKIESRDLNGVEIKSTETAEGVISNAN
jgi:hypothetical protein